MIKKIRFSHADNIRKSTAPLTKSLHVVGFKLKLRKSRSSNVLHVEMKFEIKLFKPVVGPHLNQP